MSKEYGITRNYYKKKWENSEFTVYEGINPGTKKVPLDFLRSHLMIIRTRDPDPRLAASAVFLANLAI